MNKKTITIFAFFITLIISCSQLSGQFAYMMELRDAISEEYDTRQVEVNLKNKTVITVTFKDSKFEDFSGKRKEKISHDIGEMARNLAEGQEPFESGEVIFVTERNYGIAKTSESDSYSMFN